MLATATAPATETPNVPQSSPLQDSAIHLKTIDGSSFTVPYAWVNDSAVITKWYTDLNLKEKNATPAFEIPHVTPYILEMILEFQEDNVEAPAFDEKTFKAEDICEDIKTLANEDLLQLTMAADILQLPRLTRHCAECMAFRMENKNADEIKAMFDVDQLQEVDDVEMAETEEETAKEVAPSVEEKEMEKKEEESK